MGTESRHLSEHIDRPAQLVYEYAADPANLAHWAPGLGASVRLEAGRWLVDVPGGSAEVVFVPHNDLGVLDHEVHLPGGGIVHVPFRVLADGEQSEVVFTVRRMPGMTDAEFDRDAAAVAADLALLKEILETRPR
ncbi:SRPBCC family protein [Actinoplanes regularis]|uniref:Polyketide cyclase / dehydrase and lipid transport n=1 Tax=Actinoplanes regularis TaxID=52697 RepID=A0A238Y1X6_9ACTN|nr:SRPBCC family protein [Actinoplanes regularis]GIE86296.1 polyketide cyclase [Actinoplanes regularis]GLW27995.1 polyketide cyclase [Actinoplanes regularis]SNR64624.1 Polyketide cyclase / dehydrase and lipid transport [Actinoplanes regularis]